MFARTPPNAKKSIASSWISSFMVFSSPSRWLTFSACANRFRLTNLEDRVQFGKSQYLAYLLAGSHQPQVNTSSLKRNQNAYSSSVNRINLSEIENHIAPMLLNSGTQDGSLLASHNSSVTL